MGLSSELWIVHIRFYCNWKISSYNINNHVIIQTNAIMDKRTARPMFPSAHSALDLLVVSDKQYLDLFWIPKEVNLKDKVKLVDDSTYRTR